MLEAAFPIEQTPIFITHYCKHFIHITMRNSTVGRGWIEVSTDLIDWIDVVAQCYDMTTEEVAERLLHHGVTNYESILGYD